MNSKLEKVLTAAVAWRVVHTILEKEGGEGDEGFLHLGCYSSTESLVLGLRNGLKKVEQNPVRFGILLRSRTRSVQSHGEWQQVYTNLLMLMVDKKLRVQNIGQM
ncbi:hypothetical protein EON65_44900 [archaeon]|nr:MAG: hypothetical protein EON65_44900 [archaeon]